MIFHPSVMILIWCLFTVLLQIASPFRSLILAGCILVLVVAVCRDKFFDLLRRTRWIMISLLIVYAYTTPGEILTGFMGSLSPSREGLIQGSLQLARLTAVLAGLAILLDRLSREHLIAGLHSLSVPLSWFGVSRSRFAVRLALTLQYAEAGIGGKNADLKTAISNLGETVTVVTPDQIAVPVFKFTLRDMLFLLFALFLFVLAMT